MWRATVIERIADGQVVVSIPALFRGDPVGPIQSSVDAQVGDAVVVADLVPDAKVRDWWVIGYESQVGRWGNPYPHEHPTGQITAVDANGQPTTLTAILAQKADKADVPGAVDTSGYATKEELTGYATTTALATKASNPGAWTNCTLSTYIVPDIAGRDAALSIRTTPLGYQLRGRARLTAAVPLDTVVFTLPAAFPITSPTLLSVPTMGPGSAYAALSYGLEIQVDRTVTAREALASGARMSFNSIINS